jgi:hypothetical protein
MKTEKLSSEPVTANSVNTVLTAGNFKPILFSTPMVQAILRDQKTQARLIINAQPTAELFSAIIGGYDKIPKMARFWTKLEPNNPLIEDIKLKYNIGDILWVRETWMKIDNRFVFKALLTEEEAKKYHWKPSIFMPKEACRIFLKLKSIKVERLNEISGEDAMKEGVKVETMWPFGDAYRAYAILWDKINGKGSWDKNPFVWVYEFERCEASFACT